MLRNSGDNWFAERTTHQACEIIERRLKGVNKFMDDLLKEKNTLIEQIKFTENLFQETSDYVNIEEKFQEELTVYRPVNQRKQLSEEEKKELRKKQQERALKTQALIDDSLNKKGTLNILNHSSVNTSMISDDDNDNNNNVKKLDALKNINLEAKPKTIVEKPKDQLTFEDMLKEYEQKIDRQNNSVLQKALEKESSLPKSSKKVTWLDETSNQTTMEETDNDYDDVDDDDNDDEEDEEQFYSNSKETAFQKPTIIKFKHTNTEKLNEIEHNSKVSREKKTIDCPGDIYTVFNKPKSILIQHRCYTTETSKVNKFDENRENDDDFIFKIGEHRSDEGKSSLKFEPQNAFTGEVVERINPSRINLNSSGDTGKLISKFKASKIKN